MAKKEYIYATGKRKSSIARVNIIPGIVLKPFTVANMMEKYDVEATVHGGGFAGQAGAVSHGIAKALATTDPEVRAVLKRNGLLTRDSRVKERRKYGLKKARKAPQFSKR